MINETEFYKFLTDSIDKGGFSNDDVVAVMLPLLDEILGFHNEGNVAPLDDLSSLLITNEKLDIDEKRVQQPKLNAAAVTKFFENRSKAFEITGISRETIDIGDDIKKDYSDLTVNNEKKPVTEAVYLIDYKSYEIELGHHDAATDIFILGMIMASLALHLDFTNKDDLDDFVRNRKSLVYLNHRIHPAIANIITGMTELDRNKRWKDLREIIDNLVSYRDYNPEKEMDLAEVVMHQKVEKQSRQQVIQSRLRNRLFDTSRRNRLLYFKPNLKFINLTVSSVPNVLNYRNIDPELLFFWNNDVREKITSAKDISLSKYLRFEDNPYLGPSLDRIRLEAGKDINEYGFSQLRLSICMLHWYNLKEQLTERISSPLLLIPVSLSKKKGVKDQFVLKIMDTEAEINPVLSNMLKDLYDISLPERIPLNKELMDELFTLLKNQIERTNSGIVLDYINRPRIKLIHTLAKQTLSQYKRRINRSRKMQSMHNLDYSYSTENFQPLGLQIFKNYIKPEHSSLEFLIDKDIKHSLSNFSAVAENKSVSRELYSLDDGSVNPYKWEMDVCNIVLGNFNYKKMSLVRDYNTFVEEKIQNPVFEYLFTEQPKKIHDLSFAPPGIDEQYTIVNSDSTQLKAVQFARQNESYIIQGPPGTGKSQTITNLIADYVARGKKVLFVCEKRAAIDVVYHRLQQKQLNDLCCLIHDSQSDKKAFILNLKSAYENYLQNPVNLQQSETERSVIVMKINHELNVIRDFHFMMTHELEESKIKIRELLEILINSGLVINNSNSLNEIPGYSQWLKYGETIKKLTSTTQEYTGQNYFSKHPFRYVSQKVADLDVSPNEFNQSLSKAIELISELSERMEMLDIPPSFLKDFTQTKIFLEQIEKLIPFKETNRIELIENQSKLSNQFSDALKSIQELEKKILELENKNEHWKQKLSKIDTENALEILTKYEGSFFSFLNSNYRKTKKTVRASYDLTKHQIQPKLSQVVQQLKSEYDAKSELVNEKSKQEEHFKMGDLYELKDLLEILRENTLPEILHFIKNEEIDTNAVRELKSLVTRFSLLDEKLQDNLRDYSILNFEELEKNIHQIIDQIKTFPAFSPLLKDLKFAQDSLKKMLATYDADPESMKAMMAQSSIEQFFARNRHLEKMEGIRLQYHIEQIRKLYQEFLEANATYIRACQQESFIQLIQKSEMSMAGRSDREKEEKKSLNEGRRILENEFGKNIRFKSIRELATNESGQIIRELKPVWLMSPLSVSDTLPIDSSYFDVVIFDEASQITLEEGVPPIYRASQIIIVGDEMQMPPSNFFSSSSGDPDDLFDSDDEELKYISLDADSFLTQGARKLPSVMLGWHYRSKHETLISFSNASFYQNQLLTIPDATDHHAQLEPIIAENKEQAIELTQAVLDRPISYHYLKFGVYESRTNEAEAEYIAEMIRELLKKETGLSIGVVAFSMEQQNEIESAIQRLVVADSDFDKRIEEEYKRVDDNQFNGLFFKNLENVQGDERDIIIISTCYGYDTKGKMIMNFGPINRRGGEKRLNVIFSRAKKRMCVVSSIHYYDIKNEYNEGANFFRRYLQYAEQASVGNMDTAQQILKSISGKNEAANEQTTAIASQLKKWLEEKSFVVRENVGQSHFKCHLGIKRQNTDKTYCAGILIDDYMHYSGKDVMEQYVFKPEIMEATGWNVIQVYSKDWYDDREKVLKRIMARINNEPIENIPMANSIAGMDINQIKKVYSPIEISEKKEIELEKKEVESNSTENNDELTYLIFSDGSSNKFWEIKSEGNNLHIRFGKVNTKGQTLTKNFDSIKAAEKEKEKLIRQKKSKGYK